jgi:hypothetical protein
MTDIITQPIKFLGATVLSFNSSLGLGASESSLNVDLIEDCESSPQDFFLPKNGSVIVGAPVYLDAGSFSFGGVLTSWTYNQGGSGRTYNAKISDPRQLLENTVVIVDSYLGNPIQAINYFNAYAYYESQVLQGNCNVFGDSLSGERGMPYQMVIQALSSMSPTIYSPTGYSYTINFGSFPQGLPEYYRVVGPSVTILQMLQDVCDVLGYDFHVSLLPGNIITIGIVDLRQPPASFSNIIAAYDGYATELSYGQELRNEVTKTVLFGEKQHYLSMVTRFNHFFGEDLINGVTVPVVPFRYDVNGFWISKKVDSLNLMLQQPLASNGPYTIHELDIRTAMTSQEAWKNRVMDPEIAGSFNAAVRANYPDLIPPDGRLPRQVLDGFIEQDRGIADGINQPNAANVLANEPKILEELEKIWSFIKNLGDTYYGKQFITPLNQLVCYYQDPNSAVGEKIFTDVPTNAGGWVDDGTPVLGLNDPELGLFREDDGRISCFALFDIGGAAPGGDDVIGGDESNIDGDVTPPSSPT